MSRADSAPPPIRTSWLRRYDAGWITAWLLAALYAGSYLSNTLTPGYAPEVPYGWFTWFDQHHYWVSVQAFAHFDFGAEPHYYPPGYTLLGAPFGRLSPMHPFFFVNLASLLIAFAGFLAVARRCGLGRLGGSVLFVLSAAADPELFAQWVVPWTTTPLAAALWVLLAIAAAHVQGRRRPFLLGLTCACLPILRPTDTLFAVPAVLFCLGADLRWRRLRAIDVGAFAWGVLIPASLWTALYLLIYGPVKNDYLILSSKIGFSLYRIGWKAYVIFVDPTAWIGGGEGLFRRAPWLLFGVAGLVPAMRRPVPALLAVTIVLHSLLYLSYVDMLPTNLWRFMTVRYWTWTFPALALLGYLWVRDVAGRRHRWLAIGAMAAVLLLLCVRFDPKPAGFRQSVDALDFAAPKLPFGPVYNGGLVIRDEAGPLTNIPQIRAIPMPFGVRVFALLRPFRGKLHAIGYGLDGIQPTRIHAAFGFGIPWLDGLRAGDPYGPQ